MNVEVVGGDTIQFIAMIDYFFQYLSQWFSDLFIRIS